MSISSTPHLLGSYLFIVFLVTLVCLQEQQTLAFPGHDFSSPLSPTTDLRNPSKEGAATPSLPVSFTMKNKTEVRSQVGTTAVLHCPAENVGENTVSWIRRRDYHLLTVGPHSYSSDQRFQLRYIKEDNDWQLHIRYVQARDDGEYECQIASYPPISLLVTLHVSEATSEILGGPEKYMTTGGSLRLVCVLRDNTQPPTYVFWYHDDLMINYHKTRDVRVETEGGLSVLFLSEVSAADSGNYTCAPSNAQPAHIIIHVLKGGETPAAVQSGVSIRGSPTCYLPLVMCALLHLFSSYILMAHWKVCIALKDSSCLPWPQSLRPSKSESTEAPDSSSAKSIHSRSHRLQETPAIGQICRCVNLGVQRQELLGMDEPKLRIMDKKSIYT